ncbi:hypothetical protein JOJ87_001427 [Rhodococcus ruber]|uniref:hypothetical protein n=1 Tax=Rhodococcus ruber TaxID=1830 RepID=UPI001AE1A615|nr:hypothetical protein [Rhodococcus ruber]MBP2211083.1 hypothetical protein [Rhodococcus ruber]
MAATTPRKKTVASKASASATGEFVYTAESGETITLPAFKTIKPGLLRKVRKLEAGDQFFTILEAVADEDTLAVVDEMEMEEFTEFQRAWVESSGVDLGES